MPFNTDPYSSIFDAMDQAHNEREQQTATRHGVIQQLAEQNRLPQGQGKAQSLIQRQRDKLKGFDERQGLTNSDLRDSFETTVGKRGELWNDSLANKIANNYSVEDIDYIINEANKEYGLHKDSTGTYYSRQKNGGFGIDEETGQVIPQADGPLGVFRGDLSQYSTLYRYGTKDGNEKWGLSFGDDPSLRYSDEYLAKTESFIGPKGVNRDDLQASYLLPRKLTETLEATIHGSEAYKKLRLYREDMNDRAAYQQAKADFGSGVTEAYRKYERDPNVKVNQAIWDEYKQRFNPTGDGRFRAPIQDVEDKYRQAHLRRIAEEGMGFGGRALNTAGTFASTVVNELVMSPAQWLGESTGWWDIGTASDVAKRVDQWFDVNPYIMENVTNEVKETATGLVKKYKETGEVDFGLLAKGIGQGLGALPELLAASIGFVASFYLPSGAIGKLQHARKAKGLEKTFEGIDAAVAAGTKTAQAAKAEKLVAQAVANSFTKMDKFVQQGIPFGVLTGNQLARDVEEFRKNNGGNVTAGDVLRMAPVAAAHVFIDSQASAFLYRDFVKLTRLSKGFAKDVAKDVATATPQQYSKLTRAFLGSLKAASIVGGHAALEGGQEYFQSMLEVFNSQYASEKYGTDVARILGSEMAQIEGLTAAMLGAGMGGSVSGVGRVKEAVAPTFKKAFGHYKEARAKGASPEAAAAAGTAPVDQLTPQEQAQARVEFNTLFTELHGTLSEPSNLNEENFFQVFADYRRFLYQRGFIEEQLTDEQRANLDGQINAFEQVLFGAAQRLNISEVELEGLQERALPTETTETVEAALTELFPHIPVETLRARVRTLSEEELAAEIGMSVEDLVALGEGKASIAGARSAQANAGLLDNAKALKETGMSPEQVWEETGWYQEKDGGWRYEISDSTADTTPQLKERFARNQVSRATQPTTLESFLGMDFTRAQKLSDVLDHKALFDAYPDLADIDVVVQKPAPGTESKGMVDLRNNKMLIEAHSPAEARSIMLHEAQHVVQRKEGFDSGANEKTPLVGPNRQGYTANDVYQRSLGEIEARNTQFRADEMHPKYAKTAPWQTADQFSDIAVRNPDGSVSLTAGPVKAGTSSVVRRTPSKGTSPEAQLAELGHRILDHAVANYAETGRKVRTGDKNLNTRYSRLERLHAALKDSFYAQRPHGIKNLAEEFSIPATMLDEWNSRIAALNAQENGKPIKASDVRFSKDTNKVQAVTIDGTVFVIPENIPAGSAGSVLLHEMGVHMAQADKRLGEHFRKFVGALRQMEKTGDEQAKDVIARAKQRVTEALGDRKDQENKHLWDEEFIAYTVEEAVASGIKPSAVGSELESFLDRVLNFFRTAIALVFKSENAKALAEKLTIQQVVDLAHGFAQKELTKASKRTAPANATKTEEAAKETVAEEDASETTVEEEEAPVEVTSSLSSLLDEVVEAEVEVTKEAQTAVEEAVAEVLPEDTVAEDTAAAPIPAAESAEAKQAPKSVDYFPTQEAVETDLLEAPSHERDRRENIYHIQEAGASVSQQLYETQEEALSEVKALNGRNDGFVYYSALLSRKVKDKGHRAVVRVPVGEQHLQGDQVKALEIGQHWVSPSGQVLEVRKIRDPNGRRPLGYFYEYGKENAPALVVEVRALEDYVQVTPEAAEKLRDHFAAKQTALRNFLAQRAAKRGIPQDKGSDVKASSVRKQTNQTPAQRKALQEAVVREFIEFMGKHAKDGELSESKRKELNVLGSRYNITPESVEKILKSYASVLQESTIDDTGIRTRFARIQRLLNSGTATDAAVQKEYRELTEWMYTTEASIEQLQDTIRAAEEWVETENRKPKVTVRKSKDFKSEYRTHVESTSKGAHFVIKASYDKTTKKWSAAGGIAEARKRIEEKKATRNAIDSVITYIHDNGGQHLREEEMYTDTGFRFGTASGKNSDGILKNIKAERAYMEQALEVLQEVTGEKRSANKMILSDTTSQRWKPTGSRARANKGIINRLTRSGEAYSSDDVVVLHSLGKFRVGGNKFRSDLYGTKLEAANEVAAAMEAGATIVLESTVRARNAEGKQYRLVGNTTAAKDTYPDNKKWRKEGYDAFSSQRLEEFLLSKGYMQLSRSGAGASVFVPFSQEIADKIKAKEDAAADVAARRASKDKELAKLVRAHSLVVAMRSYGYEPEGITLAEAEAKLAALEEAAKNKYFTPKALREELQAQATVRATEEGYVETGNTEAAASTERSAEDLGVAPEVIAEAAKETAVDTETELENVFTEDTVSDKASENIYAYMERNTEKAINEMVEQLRAAKAAGVLFEAKNKAIAHIGALRLGELEVTADRGTALLNVWAQSAKARASMKDQLVALREAVSNIYVNGSLRSKRRISDKGIDTTPDNAIVVGDIANNIMSKAAGAGRKLKAYAVQSYTQKGEKTTVEDRWRWDKEGLTLGDILNSKGEVVETITQINPVSLDPNNFLEVARATPLNTVPTADLPLVFGKLIDKVAKAFDARIPDLTEAERKGQKPTAYVKDGNTDQFNMVNSPARALVYQKDGTVDPAFMAAMGIALGEALKTDRKAISAGHKTEDDLANMFSVRPEEVTDGMRELAMNHGAFRKSLGRTLGKAALTSLGIARNRKVQDSDPIAKGQYEAIEADLGNMIIEVGIELGIFKSTKVASNELARLYHEGEVRDEGKEVTHFVNLVEKPYEAGKEREDIPVVAEMVADHTEIDGYMPNVAGRRTGPRIGQPHTEAELDRMASRIRNDETGALVPKEAQKAMKNFMKTPFRLNKTLADDFFRRLQDPAVKEAVMEFLGYIPIDNSHPEYAKLLAEDKKKQEGINDSITRSLEALEELTEVLKDKDEGEASRLYFGFFYSGNQRYNIDSNTVNMMADKLHRFFVTPESLNLTYSVNRSNNTFEHHYVENGEKKSVDSSLYVRAALAQAFGVGIDKTATRKIIRIGNALLSLKNEQVKALQDELYLLGKFDKSKTFAIRAPGADGKMETIELTPDHFSHALQALQFLDEYTSTDGDTINTSLTFEMDALTSGFSNKVQQFALLNNLSEHARRVGIIHQHFNVNATETEAGTNIHALMNDPTQPEYSTNDMLADKSLGLDSYQSLASTTIKALVTMVEGMKNPVSKSLFRALSPYFPGAKEVLDHNASGLSPDSFQPVIDSALRNMFKPGFMVFNYAASVSRIKKNLGMEIANGMLNKIASMDLSDVSNLPLIEALTSGPTPLLKSIQVDKKPIQTVAELQKALRDVEARHIRIETRSEKGKTSVRLDEYIGEELIEPTYGAAIEETFMIEFDKFIEIQNVTNDLFRSAFQLFDRMLLDRIKGWRAENVAEAVTEAVILEHIDALKDVFPLIAGPLSDTLRDGVHIYETDTRTPSYVMQTQRAPQTLRKPGHGSNEKTLTIHPLIRNIVSAVNSGAVLPLHALDGAQMAVMSNTMAAHVIQSIMGHEGAGILPIHDAAMVPLAFADYYAYSYNKGTVELNKNYSIMGEMVKMGERMREVFAAVEEQNAKAKEGKGKRASLDLNSITPIRTNTTLKAERKKQEKTRDFLKLRLKTLLEAGDSEAGKVAEIKGLLKDLEKESSFLKETDILINTAINLNEQVNNARENVYKDGDFVGVLVGLRGGMYRVGDKSATPNLDYLADLAAEGLYTQVENVALDSSIALPRKKKKSKEGRKDLTSGLTAGQYSVEGLIELDPSTTLSLAEVNSSADLIRGQSDVTRASISQHIIVGNPGQQYKTAMDLYESMRVTDKAPALGETVMVTAVDATPAAFGKTGPNAELFPKDKAAIEDAWEDALEAATTALIDGSVLVFNGSVVEASQADVLLDGEAFIYSQLIARNAEVNVTEVEVGGQKFQLVSKLVPEHEAVEILPQEAEESAILAAEERSETDNDGMTHEELSELLAMLGGKGSLASLQALQESFEAERKENGC